MNVPLNRQLLGYFAGLCVFGLVCNFIYFNTPATTQHEATISMTAAETLITRAIEELPLQEILERAIREQSANTILYPHAADINSTHHETSDVYSYPLLPTDSFLCPGDKSDFHSWYKERESIDWKFSPHSKIIGEVVFL